MIRRCRERDFDGIWTVINAAAQAYRGVIPEDRWHEPYMSRATLRRELAHGIVFWGYEEGGELVGVMGIQDVGDVTLIRHAYVRPSRQRQGIGTRLLSHLRRQTNRPILIGTWADAVWALRFYEKHGFSIVSPEQHERLLRRYWSIPERQVETSVVLADREWLSRDRVGAEGLERTSMGSPLRVGMPQRLIRFCGADCGQCETYRAFAAGDQSGLVNQETGYRCCWLPVDYPRGRDCPIRVCCEERGLLFCGQCDELDQCERMREFYAQPGYDALRARMLGALDTGGRTDEDPPEGDETQEVDGPDR